MRHWTVIKWIQAPMLHTLNLRQLENPSYWIERIDNILLRPKVLDMDIAMTDPNHGRRLIWALSEAVTDLQIVCSGGSAWQVLACWLRGSEEKGLLFPKLQSLVLIFWRTYAY